jgi:HEAT repeat protein
MKPTEHKRTSFEQVRLFIFFLGFVAIWSGLRVLNRPEPELSGHPLSYWIERMADPRTSAHAAATLSDVGPESLPALVDGLNTRQSKIGEAVQNAAFRINLAPPPNYDSANIRSTAAYLLGQLGTNAVRAVPDLVVALEDQDSTVRFRARRALHKIQKEASPELASQIQRAIAINSQ